MSSSSEPARRLRNSRIRSEKGAECNLVRTAESGGTCLHEGCIPTKCLCRSAEIADTITDCDTWGFHVSAPIIDFRRIMERKNEVVAQLTSGIEFLLKHKLITYIPERAELFDAHTVISESGEKYTAEHILIATGSTAKRPPIEGCDLPGVLTSTEMLDIDHIPQKLCIIGAGVIGSNSPPSSVVSAARSPCSNTPKKFFPTSTATSVSV